MFWEINRPIDSAFDKLSFIFKNWIKRVQLFLGNKEEFARNRFYDGQFASSIAQFLVIIGFKNRFIGFV